MIRALALAAVLVAQSFAVAKADSEKANLAMSPFSFVDTSGEVADQAAKHADRLKRFEQLLLAALATNQTLAVAEIRCNGQPCPADEVLAKAKADGKKYLLLGAVQKTSTLVLWAQVDVLDVATGKPVLHRWITFRGDTDEAWDRTARYIAKAINAGFST